jgi:hypothetical protein
MSAGLITVGLALTGCMGSTPPGVLSVQHGERPAMVEPIPGKETKKVILTDRATTRLAIQTVMVSATSTVPYSAILYDHAGTTWVYTVPEPRTYIRERVTVSSVLGTSAVLSAGPPAGTPIVSTGVVELYGTESGVGQ